MKTFGSLIAAAVLLLSCHALGQLVVYDNLAPPNWQPYYASKGNATEFGDEVALADSTPRAVGGIALQYYAANLSGNEWAKVRLYENDGSLNSSGFPKPKTVLFESQNLPLAELNGQGLLTLNSLNTIVPDTFTWTVQFGGLESNEVAGLALNGPPRKGMSYDDFWERNGGDWGELVQLAGAQESSFGAQITAVPEPLAAAPVTLALALAAVAAQRALRRQTRAG